MDLANDDLDSREREILDVVKRLGSLPRELIAKELNVDKMSGRLQLTLLSLTARGWLEPETHGFTYWRLTEEGREELRRRTQRQ